MYSHLVGCELPTANCTLIFMKIALMLFIVTPIVEMWVLIQVGGMIGAWPTIGLVLLTAMIGLALLRQQSFATFMRAQQKMQTGELPAKEMGEGLFLAVGGALLLTPGFMTDAVGFACLIPGIRQALIGQILKRARFVQFSSNQWQPGSGPFNRPPNRDHQPHNRENDTLEGDYRRED